MKKVISYHLVFWASLVVAGCDSPAPPDDVAGQVDDAKWAQYERMLSEPDAAKPGYIGGRDTDEHAD